MKFKNARTAVAAVALAASVVLGAALLTALASRGLLPAPM